MNSFDSNVSSSGQLFTKIATCNGQLLAVKFINKSYVAITQLLIKEINEVGSMLAVRISKKRSTFNSVYKHMCKKWRKTTSK